MAHFAKIENNIVTDCIVIKDSDCGGGDFPSSEIKGKSFIESIGIDGEWIQTSYNSNFRGKFAGAGMFYNESNDCFHHASPFQSWILDLNGDWNPPIPMPDDEFKYEWNEETKSWDKIDN